MPVSGKLMLYAAKRRKLPEEVIPELYQRYGTLRGVARHIGVRDNAIRNWFETNGWSQRDGKWIPPKQMKSA